MWAVDLASGAIEIQASSSRGSDLLLSFHPSSVPLELFNLGLGLDSLEAPVPHRVCSGLSLPHYSRSLSTRS